MGKVDAGSLISPPHPQAEMVRLRNDLRLPLHARIGIHCGTVVSGIVGSQRPRFCALDDGRVDRDTSVR